MALDDPAHSPALEARYGDQPRPDSIGRTHVIDHQLAHRSVRAYLPDALPDGTVETLVAAAQSAPSSSNLHLWSVIAVTDLATRSELAFLARNQKHIQDAPLILLWVADLARAGAIAEAADRPAGGLDYFETFLTAAIDATLAAQNAALAAESLGLGTVFIGALRNNPEAVAALVDLPDRSVVVFGLVVGKPDPARPSAVKPRPAQSLVLHHDRYRSSAALGAVDRYDAATRRFQEEQGMPAIGWIAPLLARLADADALSGRDRLRDALRARGFPLL